MVSYKIVETNFGWQYQISTDSHFTWSLSQRDRLVSSWYALQAIDHPCVIRLEDVVDTEQYLYIILELADGGELFDKIVEKTKLDEDEAKLMFYQVMVDKIMLLLLYTIALDHVSLHPFPACFSHKLPPLEKHCSSGLKTRKYLALLRRRQETVSRNSIFQFIYCLSALVAGRAGLFGNISTAMLPA